MYVYPRLTSTTAPPKPQPVTAFRPSHDESRHLDHAGPGRRPGRRGRPGRAGTDRRRGRFGHGSGRPGRGSGPGPGYGHGGMMIFIALLGEHNQCFEDIMVWIWLENEFKTGWNSDLTPDWGYNFHSFSLWYECGT